MSSLANAVDETDLGIASAAQNVGGQIGAAVGITVLTAVQASGDGAFATAFWVGTAIAAVSVGLALLLEDLDRSHERGDEAAPAAATPAPRAPTRG
jgi:hypothetical protein